MRRILNHYLSVNPLTAVLAMAVFSLPQIAQAQDAQKGAYINIGVALLTADLDLNDLDFQGNNLNLGEEDADVFAINGRLGYRFNKYIAAEVEGGFGLGGDNITRSLPLQVAPFGTVPVDADADISIDTYGAAFARVILPVNKKFDIFLRGGYGTASAEADITATTTALAGLSLSDSVSDSIDGFAYGVGAEYHLTEQHGVRFDFSAINSDAQFFAAAYTFSF